MTDHDSPTLRTDDGTEIRVHTWPVADLLAWTRGHQGG